MKIKEFKNLNEYKEFVESSKYNHYMKSISWGNIKKSNKLIPIYLGFYEDETLIGSALIFFVSGIVSYMYIPTGLCIDYHNEAILNEALDLLKKYAIKHKVAFLRIDPNIIRISKDINGNPTNDINNENITNLFIKSGFKHKGYGYGYDGSWHNRFTLIVDIDKDINIIKSNYTKQRQTAINRHNIIGLNTRIGSIEEINYLCEFEKELSKTQGFKPHSKDFFENIITNFKENSRLYITEINLDQMIEGISKELLSKKYAKDKEAKSSKEKELKEAKLLKETYGPNLVLASGLFLFSSSTSWDLYTYNRKSCNFLKPVDNLHYYAMQDMKLNKVKYYDMCGFSGSTDKSDPYYGLYSYKKSFNPEFTEYIGEFDFIINNLKYKTYLKIKKGFNRLYRKLNSIIYKRD